MNILFISALEGGKYSGTIYSVPKQVAAQSKVDNVYWINLTEIDVQERFKDIYHYYSCRGFSFEKLPTPFNNPDIIIFEEFFKLECCLVARKAEHKKIPYIIVPRCQMTQKYLQNKKIKKMVASLLLFSHFANKARAVQFLSKQEQVDSQAYYKGKNFISPNGIDIPEQIKKYNLPNEKIVGTFIGRYSVWQKGLDLLLQAISENKSELIKNGFYFELYGPTERSGSQSDVEGLVHSFELEQLVKVNGPVYDETKNEVLLNSDFFIHTSRFEGMPMAVLEALAYGLPCFVTQGSNLREEVEHYDAGWGMDVSVHSISKAIKALIHDKDLFKEKSQNACKLAKNYSWDDVAVQYQNELKKLVQ